MSQQYDNNNRAVLFPNQRKQTDKHPDLTGTINIDGKDHFFDAWITWDGPDVKRISAKIGQAKTGGRGGGSGSKSSAPRQRRELSESMPQRRELRDEFEDDIPW